MTKQCILCKIEESPLCNCSFHKFPAKEILREKWLIALNLTKSQNTRNKYVCSNHFDEQSYQSHDEYRSRKRLRSGVVPIHCLETPTENVAQKTLNEPMEVTKEISDNLALTENNYEENLCNKLLPVEDQSSVCNAKDPDEGQGLLEANESEILKDIGSKKRKCSFPDRTTRKRVRFMSGFKTEYVNREDFVSDEAWQRFIRYVAYNRSKRSAAHNKNSRKKAVIKNFKGLIKELERQNENCTGEYLQV